MRKEKQVIKRPSMLFIGIILGASGYAAVLTQSEYAKPQLHPEVDLRKAVDVTIDVAVGNEVNSRYYAFLHICCDCGLTHRVLLYEIPDEGLRMLWWRDQSRTRRARALKGWNTSHPFSAEHGELSDDVR